MGFLKPKKIAVKESPPPPERSDDQVAEAATEQRRKYAGRSASSLLTSGTGVSGMANTAAATLLGQTGGV